MATSKPAPVEVADGVYWLATGRGLTEANVYLIRSAYGWVLVDSAWAGRAPTILAAAASLFGAGRAPAGIVQTHLHPDHSGATPVLAAAWRVPVYAHREELRFASGTYLPEYANPLDRAVIGPLLRLVPRRRLAAMRARTSLEGTAVAIEPGSGMRGSGVPGSGVSEGGAPGGGVPGLPGWRCVATPGHTPGHLAFFRAADGVLISGDAAVTVELNSVRRLLRPALSGPPWYSTWSWERAVASVEVLAACEPSLLAPGHGRPARMRGGGELRGLADRMRGGRELRGLADRMRGGRELRGLADRMRGGQELRGLADRTRGAPPIAYVCRRWRHCSSARSQASPHSR